MNEAATICADLAQLVADLRSQVTAIATELARGEHASTAILKRSMAAITRLTLSFPALIMRSAALSPGQRSDDQARLQHNLAAARQQLADWPLYERMLSGQTPFQSRPLYPEQDDEQSLLRSRDEATDGLLNALHHVLNPAEQSEAARVFGCYADIGLSHSIFARDAHAAHRVLLARGLRHPTRFLDVGCGGGMKVLAATRYFDCCDGLEYQADYGKAATEFLQAAGGGISRIMLGDALTFSKYAAYDAIYFYRPLRTAAMLHQLEDHIIATARPGTLLLAPYRYFALRARHIGCGHVAGNLYLTQSTQSEADALRQSAERTGLYLKPTRVSVNDIWHPIFDASAARGFAF